MFSKKNLIRILINTLIGVIFILFWLKVVDVGLIFDKLKSVNLVLVLPFILFFMVSNFFRSLRLKILLGTFKIPLMHVILLNYLSQIFSYIIPLRAGEVSKGVYLATQYNVPFSKSLIWILFDRFLDFWLVLVLTLILLLILPTNLPHNLKLTTLILIAPSTLAAALVVFYPNLARKIINLVSKIMVLGILKRLFVKISDYIVETVAVLNRDFWGVTGLLGLTLLALISDGLGWYVFFLAVFGKISFPPIFLGSLLSALTYLLPAAPGYVGSAEASGLAVFSFGLGLDKTLTSVATVLNHGMTLFCILFFGIIALYALKFDASEVWKKFRK